MRGCRPGDVTVRVEYSTLNYKDGMILQGQGRLVRQYPHVPGIDFAGTVEESASPEFKPGDPIILTGWRVGELHWVATPSGRASGPIGWCIGPKGSTPNRRWRSAPPGSPRCWH